MNNFFSAFSWVFPGIPLKVLIVKEIAGRENFPKRNFILASNHLSHIDWLLDGIILTPRKFVFIGQADKMTGFKKLLRDWVYSYCETIPMDRNDKDSKKKALDKAIGMINKGYCLAMYPEGTRSRDGKLQSYRPGVGKIHVETGAPIVPMVHFGTYELMPPGKGLKIKKIVRTVIGKPLEFQEEVKIARGLDKGSEEYRQICSSIAKKVEIETRKLLENND